MMLTFLDNLDDEQIANAEKIAKAARREGVDPKLAVAIAFRESSLRSNPPRGSSGEIGIMQVMPGTGRGIGFDEKKLQDIDQNIEAGIKYLKQGLQATGNDPKLAAVYYNGGPGAVQALSAGQSPDPRVIDYVRAINSFGTFTAGKAAEQPPAAQPAAQPTAQPAVQSSTDEELPNTAESDAQREARIQQAIEAQNRRMGQLYGAGVGAGVSAGRGTLAAIQSAGEAWRGRPSGGLPSAPYGAPAAAPGMPPGAPAGAGFAPPGAAVQTGGLPTSAQTQRILQGTTGELGTTGRQRMAGFNERTAQVAAAKELENEIISRLQRSGTVGSTADELFARMPGMTASQFGVLVPASEPVQTAGPRPSVIGPGPRAPVPAAPQLTQQLAPPLPPPPPPAGPSGLQAVTQELRAMARPVISTLGTGLRYVAPPAALAVAGGEGATLYDELRKKDPDYLKAVLSGIMGASGLAALNPATTLPATAVGGAAALADYLRTKEPIGPFEPRFSLQSTY